MRERGCVFVVDVRGVSSIYDGFSLVCVGYVKGNVYWFAIVEIF